MKGTGYSYDPGTGVVTMFFEVLPDAPTEALKDIDPNDMRIGVKVEIPVPTPPLGLSQTEQEAGLRSVVDIVGASQPWAAEVGKPCRWRAVTEEYYNETHGEEDARVATKRGTGVLRLKRTGPNGNN